MDIAPPRPPSLPRNGLAFSDPWLPNGLWRVHVSPHPCLQRIELQPLASSRERARLTWAVACVFRSATVCCCAVAVRGVLAVCCMPHTPHLLAGQMLGSNGGTHQARFNVAVPRVRQATTHSSSHLHFWICFPTLLITTTATTTPSGRREIFRDCLYSRFSLLLSPVPSPVPVVTPHLLAPPLSRHSRPRIAQHETFLRDVSRSVDRSRFLLL